MEKLLWFLVNGSGLELPTVVPDEYDTQNEADGFVCPVSTILEGEMEPIEIGTLEHCDY